MHNTNDIYIRGIRCTKPRVDVYNNFRVHIGENNIPNNSVIARVEQNQLTILESSGDKEICRLLNVDDNYYNYSSHDFKCCLRGNENRADNFIWQNMGTCDVPHMLWCIRLSTLYLIREKIQIWNQVPELNKYLLDEDLYDLVNHKPTGRSIIFSGTKDKIEVEVSDPDDKIINMKFKIDYQSKSHLEILFKQTLASFNEKNIVADVEFVCKNYLGANFTERGMHNISSIDYLLHGCRSDIFNILYRICWRCLNTDNELLQY
jgi:hypothetical protein